MGVNGEILVRAEALEAGASDVDAIAARIRQQLDELRAVVGPLAATWTGDAATEYQSLQSRWDAGAEGLHGVLLRMAAALRGASESYARSEQANTRVFGG